MKKSRTNFGSSGIFRLGLISFIVISLIVAIFFGYFNQKKQKTVEIRNQKFFVELALTQAEQSLGLGQRDDILDNEGMLFYFEENEEPVFWMKGMQFDLDIIWIENERIAYIAKNISHNSQEVLNPKIKADMVLEIKAGISKKYGFEVGDDVVIY